MSDTLTPRITFWAGAAVAFIGALLLTWGLRMVVGRRRRQRLAQHTTGTVVENRVTTDMENSTLVHPIVEFVTTAGESLRVECTWSTQLKYPVGTRVPVYYNPDRPSEADIVGEGALGPLVLVLFAASTVALGLLMVVAGVLGFPPGR